MKKRETEDEYWSKMADRIINAICNRSRIKCYESLHDDEKDKIASLFMEGSSKTKIAAAMGLKFNAGYKAIDRVLRENGIKIGEKDVGGPVYRAFRNTKNHRCPICGVKHTFDTDICFACKVREDSLAYGKKL